MSRQNHSVSEPSGPGESMRDADYAAAIEGLAGQPLLLLDPEEGLVRFLLRIFQCLRRSPKS